MPTRLNYLLERVPLPSLRIYTFLSSSLLIGNVLYIHKSLTNSIESTTILSESHSNNRSVLNADRFSYLELLLTTILSQTISLLILINTVYCCLALTAKSIQNWIFGELRSLELQRLKDKFWNYAFYKFCFLFGVLGLENLNELVLWVSWFSVLAFALLFCQLAKERFELLAISASIRRQSLIKVLGLLSSLIVLCLGLFVVCFTIGFRYGGLSIFFFMLAETILLTLDTSYLLFKYSFQYLQQDQDSTRLNESRSSLFYYLEFFFVITTLSIDILHHLQMLFYHQTFMSMSSLIFFMQLKPLFHQLSQCLRKHKSYRIAMSRMEKKYPLLTKHDLEEKYLKQNHRSSLEEVCSICWEKFDKARCLPCGHLFHQNCLRSWLEQDTTCPICRLSLHEEAAPNATQENVVAQNPGTFLLWPPATWTRVGTNVRDINTANVQRRARNHLFRFDGARYSSWLPSFSIEINHNFPFRLGRARLTGPELTTISQNIQQIFPQIPLEIILADLQETQSMDATINNIIDHRIRLDGQMAHPQADISASDESFSSTSASNTDAEDNLEEETTNENESEVKEKTFDEEETFSWPLDPTLSFAERKQKLIGIMRRRYLEREQASQ